jgi:hypothetical protein
LIAGIPTYRQGHFVRTGGKNTKKDEFYVLTPLYSPLSADAKRGKCLISNDITPPLYEVERGMGGEYMRY